MAYSGLATLLALILGLLLFVASWLDDLRGLPGDGGMPLVATNSAAIAANCHVARKDAGTHKMVLRPLKWGVVDTRNGVAHCGFSNDVDVKTPREGECIADPDFRFCPRGWEGSVKHPCEYCKHHRKGVV